MYERHRVRPDTLAAQVRQAFLAGGCCVLMSTAACTASDSAEGELQTTSTEGVVSRPEEVAPISEAVILYMSASLDEIEARRSDYSDEADYYVMTDDLMWYRAQALDYLQEQQLAPVVRRERAPIDFVVDGEPRRYDFEDVSQLDLIVAYRPGAEPLVIAPIAIHEVADYFAGPP